MARKSVAVTGRVVAARMDDRTFQRLRAACLRRTPAPGRNAVLQSDVLRELLVRALEEDEARKSDSR